MAIYFNAAFKQHRKAKDLTQEQLADIFHVSPQAISRWETGATYPDIELLPSIASFFDITVDDLLGVDKIKDKERIAKRKEEVVDKLSKGYINDAIKMLRDAVREFPTDYELQTHLALSLEQKAIAEKDSKEEMLSEAIAICERVLVNATDDDFRCSTLFTLSQCYKEMGDREKAVNTAKKMSCMANAREVLLTTIYEGDELHEHLKRNILALATFLVQDISDLANDKYKSSPAERITLLNKTIAVYALIFDENDYGFTNYQLCLDYCELAKSYYQVNDKDNALHCLEKSAQHAVDFDALADFKHHTSLAVRGLEKSGLLIRNEEHKNNLCHDMLTRNFPAGNFKSIKDNARYKAVITKLEKYAALN